MSAVLTLVRRLLNYPVSIGLLLEVALLGAIPYLLIGAIVSVLFGEDWQQVQDIKDVGGERLARHVVQRQLRPVEVDIARFEDQSFVVGRLSSAGKMWTDGVVVDREHAEQHTRYPRYRESPCD